MKAKKLIRLFGIAIFAFISLNASVSRKDKIIYDSSVDLSKYPNSSAIVLYDYTKIIINKDMSYKKIRRIVTKILNYRGKKENSERKIYFDKRFENVNIARAVTAKKIDNQFKIIPTDKNAIKILDAPDEAGFMNYAVHKMEVVAFSNVETGNIVDIKYSLENNKKQPFSEKIFFGYKEPIYKIHYEVVMPKNMKIHYNKLEGVKTNEKIVGNRKIMTWEAMSLPQIIREGNKPENDLIVPTLYISIYKGWKQFKNRLLRQYDKNVKVTDNVRRIVNSLVSSDDNKIEKVSKISQYLAKRIANKNVGSLKDFDIRPVDDIISSGYAASFDRVALFLSMMKVIGIKGYPIALGPELLYWNNEKDFIQIEDFNKIIALITIDGNDYYVDPSNEYYPIGYVTDENRIGLIIKKGDINFASVLNKGKYINKEKIMYDINISENGMAVISESHVYWGDEAVKMRRKYKYMTPIQKMQDYQHNLGNISENVEPISESMFIDLNYPVKISYKYRYNNYAVREGNFIYFDIPSNLSPFRLNKPPQQRKYPYVSRGNNIAVYEIKTDYPASLKPVIIPSDRSIKTDVFTVNRTIKSTKGELNIVDRIEKHYGIIAKKQYNEFYKKVVELSHPKYYKILLKKRKFLGIF